MKTAILAALLFIVSHSAGLAATISGKVIDASKKGIAFAIVQEKGTYNGIYTDEKGNFAIDVKVAASVTLTVYCMGYETKEVALGNTTQGELVVELSEKLNELEEVSVSASKGHNNGKVKILGKAQLKCEGQAYMNVGTEYGIFLKDKSAINGTLDEVVIYITDIGIPDSRFRIHVYDAKEQTKLPVKDISGGNIIAHANKGNEWVRINVSDKNIKIKDGLVVSIEWISGYGNSPEVKSKGVMKYQGQVMGLTTDYGKKNKYVKFIFEDRQATNAEWLVPMIYCTYHK